jgi:mevalonate kinase
MLMGEHAVLHGHAALCAAIDRRIRVQLTPRSDRDVHLHSALGTLDMPLDDLTPARPFQFVLGALMRLRPASGVDLHIEADFSADIGFGSSAAVTVATVAALHAARGEPLDRAMIFSDARAVLHAVQGRGSGADLAAATYGGIVRYRADPLEIEPLIQSLPLSAHYVGHKTPTAEVIRILDERWAGREAERETLFAQLNTLTLEATAAIRNGDIPALAALFAQHRALQKQLGCEDDATARLLDALDSHPDTLACKISGSGLGDCVIALGADSVQIPDFHAYPVHLTREGVTLHD